jgi:hypothetical protein
MRSFVSITEIEKSRCYYFNDVIFLLHIAQKQLQFPLSAQSSRPLLRLHTLDEGKSCIMTGLNLVVQLKILQRYHTRPL